MTEKKIFWRKVMYFAAIAVLLVPLSWLSQPATPDPEGHGATGGKLAQLREEHNLSQANLGEIDPTSETIKLATLGMRGVAVNLLWDRANEYKKTEDWAGLSAAVEQITKLQPNFFSIWDFQAHNLSYNISVEFDDYHDRYDWVMKGVEFLKQGKKYNERNPRFPEKIGWILSQKIGRADEQKQYRRLFREDDDFHANDDHGGKTLSERDNWLVGKKYFIEGQELADRLDAEGIPLSTSPLLYHNQRVMAQINYADALETDGTFGEVAKNAWSIADGEITSYSQREIPTSFGRPIRLGEMEQYQRDVEALTAQLEALAPGVYEQIKHEKRDKLSDDERAALDKPTAERTAEEYGMAQVAEDKIQVDWKEVANRAGGDKRDEMIKLAAELKRAGDMVNNIERYREIVNYTYWKTRCEAEPTEAALQARELTFRAGRAFEEADVFEAQKLYEQAWEQWRIVLDQFEVLRKDNIMAEDLVEEINKYKSVLQQTGGEFPEPFILQDIIDLNENPGIVAPPKADEHDHEAPENDATESSSEDDAPDAPAADSPEATEK